MKNRASSPLIEQYLAEWQSGRVAEITQQKLRKALRAILLGVDVDLALQITRKSGPSADAQYDRLELAVKVHRMRERREKWTVIHRVVNEWLSSISADPLSEPRLKNLYREHLEEIPKWQGRIIHVEPAIITVRPQRVIVTRGKPNPRKRKSVANSNKKVRY